MGLWTMVFLIVLISLLYAAFDSWLRHRSKLAKHGGGSGALQQEVEDLRVRLEALETIVTTPDFDLKRQIDALEAPRRRSLG